MHGGGGGSTVVFLPRVKIKSEATPCNFKWNERSKKAEVYPLQDSFSIARNLAWDPSLISKADHCPRIKSSRDACSSVFAKDAQGRSLGTGPLFRLLEPWMA